MKNYCFAWAYLLVLGVGCDIYQKAQYKNGLSVSVGGYEAGQQAQTHGLSSSIPSLHSDEHVPSFYGYAQTRSSYMHLLAGMQ